MINRIIKIFILISVFVGSRLFAQVNYKINIETGLFKSRSEIFNSNKDFIARLTGNLSYKYAEKNTSIRAAVKIQPGLIGADFNIDLLKYKASGNFHQRYTDFGWGVNISTQKNLYYDNQTFHHRTTTMEFTGSYNLFKSGLLNLSVGYVDQQVMFSSDQELKRIYASLGMIVSLINNLAVSTGIYLEDYDLSSHSNLLRAVNYKNNGYRIGPKIYVSYLEKVSLRFSYSFIYQKSDVLDESVYEHQLRFIAGKIFNDWSVFAMIEYTDNLLKETESTVEETNLLRFPANYENNYYIKVAKELTSSIDVYFKLGYFNENIKYADFKFSGWNFLIGFEIIN